MNADNPITDGVTTDGTDPASDDTGTRARPSRRISRRRGRRTPKRPDTATSTPVTGTTALIWEVVLALAIVAASTPLSLLIDDQGWLVLVLLSVVTVCGTGAIMRFLVRSTLLVVPVQLCAMALMLLLVELRYGLVPWPAIGSLVTAQWPVLLDGVRDIIDGRAPMLLSGPAMAVMLVLVMVIVLALEILFVDGGWHAPTAYLLLAFMLVPALMHPSGGPWYTVAGPVVGALLVLSVRALFPSTAVLVRRGRGMLAALACAVLVAGATPVVAGALPSAEDPPYPVDMDRINAWQGREFLGYGAQMIDDSVSVRRGLMQGEEREVLRYATDDPDPGYLRVSSLTVFDGERFLTPQQVGASPEMETRAFSDRRQADRQPDGTYTHDIILSDMAGARLPTPANVRWSNLGDQVELEDVGRTGGELVLGNASRLSGLQYEVASEPTDVSAQELRSVGREQMQQPYEQEYIHTRSRPDITELAEQVAEDADAEGAFDVAMAYQDFFRRDFDYSLTVRSEPGEDPISAFLDERVGYCEQFAATFALMMNDRGYPTRVVVGYTPGEADGDDMVVTNHNAHAWPEVWFGAEYGWVPFEPTPPGATSGASPPNFPETPETQGTDSGESDVPDSEDPTDASGEDETDAPEEDPESSSEEEESTEDSSAPGAPGGGGRSLLVALSVGVGMAGIAALAAVVARIWLHRRREERWAAAAAAATGATSSGTAVPGGGDADGAGGATTGPAADPGAPAALAWTEIGASLRNRKRIVRAVGWSRILGRHPVDLHLDQALSPPAAMETLLRDAAAGGLAVTREQRDAAARIAEAVVVARYAPQVPEAQAEQLRADVDTLRALFRSRPSGRR